MKNLKNYSSYLFYKIKIIFIKNNKMKSKNKMNLKQNFSIKNNVFMTLKNR